MARPKVLLENGKEKYNIDDMCETIDKYVNKCKDDKDKLLFPILKELCVDMYWNYDYVMQLERDHPKLSQSIKRLCDLKVARLEMNGVFDNYNARMTIFSLKQLGWRDNIEVNANEKAIDVMKEFNESLKNMPIPSREVEEDD